MGLFESIRSKPQVGMGVGAVTLGLAAMFTWSSINSGSSAPRLPSQMYFSDDDGKTFFADDSANIAPFDHNGKPALGAAVFKRNGKPPFVGYLIRYNNEAKTQLDAMPPTQRRSSDPKVMDLRRLGEMVKKPGDTNWVALSGTTPVGQILSPTSPDAPDETAAQINP